MLTFTFRAGEGIKYFSAIHSELMVIQIWNALFQQKAVICCFWAWNIEESS